MILKHELNNKNDKDGLRIFKLTIGYNNFIINNLAVTVFVNRRAVNETL